MTAAYLRAVPPPGEVSPTRQRPKHLHVAVRIDEATLDRIERLRGALGESAAKLGVLLSQSDVLRSALGLGFVALEKQYGLPAGPSTIATPDGRRNPRK